MLDLAGDGVIETRVWREQGSFRVTHSSQHQVSILDHEPLDRLLREMQLVEMIVTKTGTHASFLKLLRNPSRKYEVTTRMGLTLASAVSRHGWVL